MTFNFGSLQKKKNNFISLTERSITVEKLPINVELLNRKITLLKDLAIVEAIHQACLKNEKMTVTFHNVHSFNLSMQIPWFYEFQQSAEIVLCDGFGILKALNYMGLKVPPQYRIAGTNLVPRLLEYCDRHNLSIYLLGTKPEVLAQAIQSSKNQYPRLKVFGHHGYFDKTNSEENYSIINQINQIKPNILVVGMGMPLQEQWLFQYRPYIDANVFLPCGAIIDRLAGIVPECPSWISNLGFEWAHRLSREPKRLAARYLLGNPAFLLQVLLAKSLDLSNFDQRKIADHQSRILLEYRMQNAKS